MSEPRHENVEERIARVITERHQCERRLLGITVHLESSYEVFVIDQARGTADARRLPHRDLMLLGVPILEVMSMHGAGCYCGHHFSSKARNQVERRHRSAAFAVLGSGRNFEIWWRDGDEVFRRNYCPEMVPPEYKQDLDTLNRLAQQIADLDPTGKP